MALLPNGSYPINMTSLDWAQVYCLKPPNDSCDLICPNPDVTGMGQQFSIYVTEIIFGILLLYWPEKIRITMYSHYALIFSLLISATTSISQQQLTQNDAIFVVLMVASPTSIYLWMAFLFSFCKPALCPTSKIGGSFQEIFLLKSLCCLTLFYEIGMAVTVFGLLETFSQAACFQGYSKEAMSKLLWPVMLVLQILGCVPVLACPLPDPERKALWRKRPAVSFASWFHRWTPRALWLAEGSGSRFTRVILAAIQAQVLTTPLSLFFPLNIDIVFASFFFGCALILSMLRWKMVFKNFAKGPQWRSYVAAGVIYVYLPVILGFMALVNVFGPSIIIRDETIISTLFYSLYLIPQLNLLSCMIFLWSVTSPPSQNSDDNVTIWSGLMSGMHILKFGLLIATPSALWVSSTMAANPTVSAWGTFGQV
ncbi:hypothetical protein AX14_008860 [Amanita brunnescens Koide BX004]|nr:hypothetical protein AX14_008860 [Amanita brunnescens Koide BX004]